MESEKGEKEEGKIVANWYLHIDIYILDHDGGLIDVSAIALWCALKSC